VEKGEVRMGIQNLEVLIKDAEALVMETQRCVEKGWERKSRLKEVEAYLLSLKAEKKRLEK
jgi:hypothetical protein